MVSNLSFSTFALVITLMCVRWISTGIKQLKQLKMNQSRLSLDQQHQHLPKRHRLSQSTSASWTETISSTIQLSPQTPPVLHSLSKTS